MLPLDVDPATPASDMGMELEKDGITMGVVHIDMTDAVECSGVVMNGSMEADPATPPDFDDLVAGDGTGLALDEPRVIFSFWNDGSSCDDDGEGVGVVEPAEPTEPADEDEDADDAGAFAATLVNTRCNMCSLFDDERRVTLAPPWLPGCACTCTCGCESTSRRGYMCVGAFATLPLVYDGDAFEGEITAMLVNAEADEGDNKPMSIDKCCRRSRCAGGA